MDNFTETWRYKDIAVTRDNFDELWKQYINDDLDIEEDNLRIMLQVIFNKYCQSTIAFDMIEDFYIQFFTIFYDEAEYFNQKLKMIKSLRKLNISELIKEYENITNLANNDNKIVNNPFEEIIPYISNQSTSVSRSNKATAIVRAIATYRNNEVKYFLDKFRILFISVFGNSEYFYWRW